MDALRSALPLVAVSGRSVCSVAACAWLGVYARRQEVLTEKNEKVLDKLVTFVFLPCLILSKVTPHVTPADMLSIWPLAVVCLAVVSTGLATGACIARSFGAQQYRGLLMTAVAFPNSFAVPLTLVLSLGPHPALLADEEAVASAGAAKSLNARVEFLFLASYAIWVMARWGIGFPILTGAISFQEWRSKVLNPPVKACLLASSVGLARSCALRVRGMEQAEAPLLQLLEPLATAVSYGGRCSVPVLLMALGMKIDGAVREMRSGLRTSDSKDVERAKIMPAVVGAAQQVDQSHSSLSAEGQADNDAAAASDAASLPVGAYVAVLLARQVVSPFLGALLIGGFLRGWCGVTDKVLMLVGMMQTAGPPMINLSVMAGVSGTAERETAKLLLVTYCGSVVTWVFATGFFLQMLAS